MFNGIYQRTDMYIKNGRRMNPILDSYKDRKT